MGSLGQQRFVAIAKREGGHIARQAKAMLPSACVWLDGRVRNRQSYYQKAIQFAVRSHDPFQKIVGTWLIRRLSPESNPIEIADLPEERDKGTLLYAMDSDAANVHLGSKRQIANIWRDLRRRESNWLRSASPGYGQSHRRRLEEVQGFLRRGVRHNVPLIHPATSSIQAVSLPVPSHRHG